MNAPVRAERPELGIGLTLDDLKTVEDCDAAFEQLNADVARIEAQLAAPRDMPGNEVRQWRAKANSALRHKKSWMPRLQERRGVLLRERKAQQGATRHAAYLLGQTDKRRTVLKVVHEIAPEVLTRASAIARERHPELFEAELEAMSIMKEADMPAPGKTRQ